MMSTRKGIIGFVFSLVFLMSALCSAREWLEISGDYRFRFDSLKGEVHEYYDFNDVLTWMSGGPMPALQSSYDVENDTLLLNRFGLNLKAKATENVVVKARLLMYKVWGHQTTGPVEGGYFADRAFGTFDGSIGHVPEDNILRVDYAYATWSNILDTPTWFSIGRRISTGGIPTNIRQNTEKPGGKSFSDVSQEEIIETGSDNISALLIDYAFDGLTLGYAPDIELLPGAYAKFCYGRGYDSGFTTDILGSTSRNDTDFIGMLIDPIYTENLNVEFVWIRGFNIFDNMPDSGVNANLGDIDLYGITVLGKLANLGIGDLNLFGAAGLSKTHPTDDLYGGMAGLLYDAGSKKSHTGKAIYIGARYDIKETRSKIGFEYDRGSRYWINFTPAADDIWTSKTGTRGDVYDVYLIQELPDVPVSKNGRAYCRLGYQYYHFNYTGSNNWLGEPKDIDELNNLANAQMLPPLKNAHDIYLTLNVEF